MDFYSFVVQFLLVLLLIYLIVSRSKRSYWRERGITGPTPWPLVGNFIELAWKGQPATEVDWMKKYGRLYGSFQGKLPSLTILDHELIKQVLVKDFNCFVNRKKVRSENEIWSRNMFHLEGDDWKRVRTIVSPSFTSGKLKAMDSLMNRCVNKMMDHLNKVCSNGGAVVDAKEMASRFSIDVIASTAFATETNSNYDESSQNDFVTHGIKLLHVPLRRLLAFLLVPKALRNLINLKSTFLPDHFNFFRDLARQVMRQREASQSDLKRHDLIQLMMDAIVSEKDLANSKYDHLTADIENDDCKIKLESSPTGQSLNQLGKSLTANEIIAQCIFFIVAGFDTTSSTITFAMYELAQNMHIQKHLYEEISQSLEGLALNSNQYYEAVMKMPFLEAVIKETLRKYPPVVQLERRVVVDSYKLANIELHKDDLVNIPTFAVHRHPDYYPEPELFKPDRFLPENKHLLVPYTFLPFGQGPRNCIGMRFAYQEIKLLLSKLLCQFEFRPCESTPKRITFTGVQLLNYKSFQLCVTKR